MDNNIPNKNLFERIFSIDELKFSGLTLVLFVLVGFAGYELIKVGDVPSNLTGLIEICVGAIAGVNAFSFVGNGFGMSKNQNGMPMQNQYGYSNTYSPYGNSSMGMGMNGMNTMGMNSMGSMPMNNSMISNSALNPTGQPLGQTSVTSPATTSTAANMQRGI